MHSKQLFAASLLAGSALASLRPRNPHAHVPQRPAREVVQMTKRAKSAIEYNTSPYLNNMTEQFVVNGSAIPQVNFDVGESYAGQLSIDGNATNENKLFFWFFPSSNVNASNEIVIWLNGGPGCSSLDGLLQENGPFLWQSGTYEPQPNPFSWTNLTNMVWVDQPIGTGLSSATSDGPSMIHNEVDVAREFAGFWQNFMTAFNMTGRDVYVTGESYAGMYVPYIASYMLDQNNTEYYNVKGIQINDPSIGLDVVTQYSPIVPAMNHFANVLSLNDSFIEQANQMHSQCGYDKFLEEALTFPPSGKFTAPNVNVSTGADCDTYDFVTEACILVNPCFNIYHLIDFCPFLWDEFGFPSLAIGPDNYFNQSDVQKALNVPPTNYAVCGDPTLFPGTSPPNDTSYPSSFVALPSVIERTNNVVVGSGLLDFLLFTNGTLATLNNMTWNGKQGFSQNPMANQTFFVPYNPTIAEVLYETETQSSIPSIPVGLTAGGGILGTTYSERGLTFSTVNLAGHEIPQYVPGAAYRQLEFLLGRIPSLETIGPFTTQE